jgi:aminoglycoside phosphotransferase (APT) family kinase protein
MNAVYRLDHAGVIVRVAMGAGAAARVERVVQVATLLTNLGAPTVPLAPGYERAVHVDGWSASIWTLLRQPPDQVWAPVHLAGPLRAVHAIAELPMVLPSWNPVAKSRQRLSAVDSLNESDRHYMHEWSAQVGMPLNEIVDRLHRWCDDLDEAVNQVEWHLPHGVIHGDAHTGNLLVTPDGRTVLCDLDSVAIGPREWDLTPAAHGPVRFGRDRAEYTSFAEEYGFDVTTWPCWETLCQIRELQLVTSVIASLAGRPVVAEELAHRLRSIFAGDRTTVWHRYE